MHGLESIVTFFLIGWLGYWLTRRGWFGDESSSMLSRLVAQVTIPLNLIYYLNTATTKEHFLPILPYVLLPTLSILVTMGIGALTAGMLRVSEAHRGVFISAYACSNTINIGLPLNLALFGTESLPAILVYYMGNTIVFWTIGNYLVASCGSPEPVPLVSRQTLSRAFPPPIIAFFAGLALLLLDVRIPSVFADACRHVGGMTTPLAIICIGIAICQTGLSNLRVDRELAAISFGRFVVSPLVLLGFMCFFPVPDLMRKVFIIQSSLPPMSSIALLAIHYKTDSRFAAVAVSLTTLTAPITVPVFMMLIG